MKQSSTKQQIRLGDIAYARSGDKGSSANVGVIARTPQGFTVLRSYLSVARVEKFFKPLGVGKVIRYELQNLGALPKLKELDLSHSQSITAAGIAQFVKDHPNVAVKQ